MSVQSDFSSIVLSAREKAILRRRSELHAKYEEAVGLYADTDMPLYAIAEKCRVSAGGLGNYLRRYWRELVLDRHQLSAGGGDPHAVKIMEAGKQNVWAHAKYKDAVAACDSLDYIDLNVSQVARKFHVNGTALANFMRIHYADTLVWREKVRRWLGINDNVWHGARPECTEQYAEAVELYRTTDMTVPQIAELCKVSFRGLGQHLRFYHKDVLKQKKQKRREAQEKVQKKMGDLSGNGKIYRPLPQTEEKYREALALYRDTALTMKEIVARTGVSTEGFRSYLHKWHKELVLERMGITEEGETDLRKAKKRLKTVAGKYEAAIESLRSQPRPIAQVAAEFGFHPETLRDYLHKYEPELIGKQSMVRSKDGKLVSQQSKMKYAEALRLYETTTEDLKSIAKRLGLTYNSLGGYLRRNCPEIMLRHRTLLEQEK